MRTLKRIVLGVTVLSIAGIAALLVAARFSDGPLAIIAGGPFRSGERIAGPVDDWSFVHDTGEVQFQLLDPPRSRTTWIIEHDGKAYIPSGYMTTWWGRLWKQWPHEAEKDGRILLRVDGKVYEGRLVRIRSGPLLGPLTAELARKYAPGSTIPVDAVTSGYLWFFEIAPRS